MESTVGTLDGALARQNLVARPASFQRGSFTLVAAPTGHLLARCPPCRKTWGGADETFLQFERSDGKLTAILLL
jgi:hypothetical protein